MLFSLVKTQPERTVVIKPEKKKQKGKRKTMLKY